MCYQKAFDGLYYADAQILLIYLEDQFLNNVDFQTDEFLSIDRSHCVATFRRQGLNLFLGEKRICDTLERTLKTVLTFYF